MKSTLFPATLKGSRKNKENVYQFFSFKYILLIMVLQLLHFPSLFPSALHPPPTHIPSCLVHVHGFYIEVPWLLHFLYYS